MLMFIQTLVKFCDIKRKQNSSVTNLRKMTVYNPNIDHVSINVYTQFSQILFFKVLRGNKSPTSFKGRNSCDEFAKNDALQFKPRSYLQNLVTLCPLVLKILSGNTNITEGQDGRIRQIQYKSFMSGLPPKAKAIQRSEPSLIQDWRSIRSNYQSLVYKEIA